MHPLRKIHKRTYDLDITTLGKGNHALAHLQIHALQLDLPQSIIVPIFRLRNKTDTCTRGNKFANGLSAFSNNRRV